MRNCDRLHQELNNITVITILFHLSCTSTAPPLAMSRSRQGHYPSPYMVTENTTMTAAHISWSTDDMEMKEFVAAIEKMTCSSIGNCADEAHVLCRVETGYQGCDIMHECSADEVFWVRNIYRQKRLVVMDTRGRYLSIPITYHRKFIASYDDGYTYVNSPKSLSELSDELRDGRVSSLQVENDEPVLVNVGSRGSTGLNERLGTLTVIESYDEKYLVVHSICNGFIYWDVTSIPVYMPITIALAEDFRPEKRVTNDFDKWMMEMRTLVSTIPTQKTEDCKEIIMFDKKPSCDYEYVTPFAFVVNSQRQLSQLSQTTNYEEIIVDSNRVEHRQPFFRPPGRRYDVFDDRRSELPPLKCVSTNFRYRVVSNDYDDPPLPPRKSESDDPPPLVRPNVSDDLPPPIPDRSIRNKLRPCLGGTQTTPSDDLSPPSLPPKSPSFTSIGSTRRRPPAIPPDVLSNVPPDVPSEDENGQSNGNGAYERTLVSHGTRSGPEHAYQAIDISLDKQTDIMDNDT